MCYGLNVSPAQIHMLNLNPKGDGIKEWDLWEVLKAWDSCLIKEAPGTSPVVQWLRFSVPNAGGLCLIPGQETRSHMPQLRSSAAK